MNNFTASAAQVVDDYLERSGVDLTTGIPMLAEPDVIAAYSKKRDQITILSPEVFRVPDRFYSVLFHELAHSTGHPDRLDRPGVGVAITDPNYAIEELVAEYVSSFLDQELGVRGTEEHHAAYLKKIIELAGLTENHVIVAARQAIQAADLILGQEVQVARRLVAA